jgi:hypothetical protein
MTTVLFIASLMGGCASAWLCEKYFGPWRRAAWAKGGPRSRRANLIAAWLLARFSLARLRQRLFCWRLADCLLELDWLKVKNLKAPAVRREAQKDWGR